MIRHRSFVKLGIVMHRTVALDGFECACARSELSRPLLVATMIYRDLFALLLLLFGASTPTSGFLEDDESLLRQPMYRKTFCLRDVIANSCRMSLTSSWGWSVHEPGMRIPNSRCTRQFPLRLPVFCA